MEFVILIIAFFICYMVIVNVGIRLLRALFQLPQGRHGSGWASHHDYLFGKPLDRYERRERKGRLRNW